jgi:hypothetical protein
MTKPLYLTILSSTAALIILVMWVIGIASADPKAMDFCTRLLRADHVVMAVFGLMPSALYEVFGISDG